MPGGALREGWLRYDAKRDLIEVDVTGVDASSEAVIDEIFDALESLAHKHPQRYVLACWKSTTLRDPRIAAHYGVRTTRLLRLVKQVVRYAADDPMTRALVRSQAVQHSAEGMRTNLYETRAEALAAIDGWKARERLQV